MNLEQIKQDAENKYRDNEPLFLRQLQKVFLNNQPIFSLLESAETVRNNLKKTSRRKQLQKQDYLLPKAPIISVTTHLEQHCASQDNCLVVLQQMNMFFCLLR